MRIYVLILFILLLSSVHLLAQSSCERNLNEARSDYSSGNLYAVPGKLGDCLEDGFSKTEKIQALRLLTLTYININQQEKAKATLIKLLNLKTDYQVNKNVDPNELYSLYRKIDTDIKYFIGVTFGFNLNSIKPHFSRNTYPLPDHEYNYISKISSPQVGLQFLYPINKNIIAGAEIQYQNQKYSYSEVNDYDNQNITTISYDSNNNGINLNLMLRYMKDYYQLKPFAEIGTSGRANLTYEIIDYLSEFPITVDDENINDEISIYSNRSKFNFSLNANIGTMVKVGENYAEIKFGVSNYFRNHLNEKGKKEANISTILDGMVLKDDNFTNLIYQVNLTFNIPFFNFQ